MKLLKKLALTSALVLLGTADSHAGPRRPLLGRRVCVSPAPTRVASAAPRYDTIPAPVVPVPTIPPGVQMPTVGLLTLPARVVQTVGGCVGGTCNVR